jgi:hypothetical protein
LKNNPLVDSAIIWLYNTPTQTQTGVEMELNRRGFLKSLGAVAVLATMPTLVEAAIAPVQLNKYEVALGMLDACRVDGADVNAEFDKLLAHMRDNFPTPKLSDASLNAVRHVIRGTFSEADLRSIPPVVADEIYTIVLARLALRNYALKVDPQKLSNFNWFHKVYGPHVIQATA